MNNVEITDWIASLETSAKDVGLRCLDIIVDQSGSEFSLIPALESFSPEIKWCSLFQGLPEEIVVDDAPVLIRIDLTQPDQRQWMQEIIWRLREEPLLLILCSSWSFDLLAQYLIQCADAAYAGQAGILRFFDPRIFPVLFSHVLDAEQQQQLLRPVLFWSWLDRDGISNFFWGEGNAEPVSDAIEKIDLTDKQLESLLCVSDAHLLMPQLNPYDYPDVAREHLFNLCYALMVEAFDKPILLDDDRASFVLEHLKARLSLNEGAKDEKTPI
ncbi:DUF4123 domain-containing protein [Photorhabdus heterorhabditis]|uniref:DUF4123 domain-containing protein n=1 Tax=Photorhabdus heterorhabditis TaxID=880156 RepID=A0ABR5K6F0_9GAMM|nr:DUF4123 domain-containing protein [Photorhabdus heterorhabditis]KOY60123.1 hypothetical protein AM629_21155 [Photorhabdus heterorhabditis]MBS9444363.1 DUF4123 domain-containing protein [Photorhabdus heterorhabditis]